MKIKKKIKNFLRDFLRFLFGAKIYNRVRFCWVHRYYPNFEEPKSFSEKIFARKFDSASLLFSSYVDKFTVRDYVSRTIGEEYLIPLISKTVKITPEFFNKAPEKFVLKTSNGGGGENVMIVLDKSKLRDLENISKQFNRYLKIKIGEKIDEPFYDIERPQILMEELLVHQDGSLPSDYKLHIFQGDKVVIQVDSDRFSHHKRSLFSESLEKLDYDIQPKYDSVDSDYVFPDNMDELIQIAKKLAASFSYVRVDMYNVDGKIYFGELTFCHGSGWEPLSSKDADLLLGSYWMEYDK
ncbi:ATP-grasp fold amidoligase family protein [Aeromonas caviae]|uniref:ATP-grasp fold amidoligase family protein n=1 Tax=Aeromonas caviae TaxID=648 RepID=UPI0029DAA969|nr:ATP-grasp fold amidoligase family protein [Aeromonas caviae]MDX7767843.1 ATP-grasp fold amidoligase family protein [Aeromonas caviae]